MELMQPIRDPDLVPRPNPDAARRVRFFHAFATGLGTPAFEREVPKGGPVRGVFSYALLEALKYAPADADGVVWGSAVKDYVLNLWATLVGEDPIPEPDIPIVDEKDIAWFSRHEAPEATLRVTILGRTPPGEEVALLNDRLVEVGRAPVEEGVATLTVAPGTLCAVRLSSDPTRCKMIQVMGGTREVEI
jgi:hypothetical protein